MTTTREFLFFISQTLLIMNTSVATTIPTHLSAKTARLLPKTTRLLTVWVLSKILF
jgi:hypothetical protein